MIQASGAFAWSGILRRYSLQIWRSECICCRYPANQRRSVQGHLGCQSRSLWCTARFWGYSCSRSNRRTYPDGLAPSCPVVAKLRRSLQLSCTSGMRSESVVPATDSLSHMRSAIPRSSSPMPPHRSRSPRSPHVQVSAEQYRARPH
jgi:hypothetical protein